MRTQEITVASYTDDKGRKFYSVSRDGLPLMASSQNVADAVRCLAKETARLATRSLSAEIRYWDGDLGDYTNAYPLIAGNRSTT